ncbi:M23 family metallopeptidase [Pedobacter boryungensis]|uniref:M23 family metallopeptidase n=1 Tax=Pedobacter boryungensis TaxID=869962 RepID=A0ABX2DEM4_9SPHI|nr:M23 family metallopeptidase [Pedobacter boryungensis]NQX32440.1 M23 family metallopeptidase [Pedobacter boryungensis]
MPITTKYKKIKLLFLSLILLTICGVSYVNIIGQKKELFIPVVGANIKSWDSKSYWCTPWGKSKVHKGIDIFAKHKTEILSPINGFILSAGYSENGGNYLYILGPKLRIYYFAHLNTQEKHSFSFIKKRQHIGIVGNSGNAISSPYHLHFSIFSFFPIVKYYSGKESQGWMKMFYLDPVKSLITS